MLHCCFNAIFSPSKQGNTLDILIDVQLGHATSDVYPALTPLLGAHPGGGEIPGLSLDVDAAIKVSKEVMNSRGSKWNKQRSGAAARPGFLFTHRGTSF